ncbi:MAG: helix-turn-helix transcriptional regulator [Hyphomicrobiaceae bacterium]
MFKFNAYSWDDGDRPSEKYSSIPSCWSTSFHLNDAPCKRLCVSIAEFTRSGVNAMVVRSSGHEIEVTDEGSLTLMLPSQGTVDVKCSNRERHAEAGGLIVLGPSRRWTRVEPPRLGTFEACLLKVPISCSELHWTRADDRNFRLEEPFVPTAHSDVESLRVLIDYFAREGRSAHSSLASVQACALAEALLFEHLRKLLEGQFDAGKKSRTMAPVRLVREAEDFMQAHFSEALTLARISTGINVHPRSLQAAFQKADGRTLWSTLNAIRLKEARRRLLIATGDENVTAIAISCGLTHLGRFSLAYRGMFGESPSETLHKRRNGARPYRPRA